MAVITKQRKTFTVIYAVYDEGGNKTMKREVFYDYHSALNRKKGIESNWYSNEINVNLSTKVIDYLIQYSHINGSRIWSISKYKTTLSAINNYLIDVFKNKRIKDINSENVSKFIKKLENHSAVGGRHRVAKVHVPIETVRKSLSLLRESFDYLVMMELIEVNPFLGVKLSRKKEKKAASPDWKMNDVVKLFDKCNNDRLFVFLHLYFSLNLEITEILALTWNDIEIDEMNNIFNVKSDKRLIRQNKEFIQSINQDLIIKIFPNYAVNDSNTALVLLKNDTKVKQRNIPLAVVNMLKQWHKNSGICDDEIDFVIKLEDGRPYDQDNMKKNFRELKKVCLLEDYTLVKFGNYAMRTNNENTSNAAYYYQQKNSIIKIPLTVRKGTGKCNYAKRKIHRNDINDLLPDTKDVIETKKFIKLVQSNEKLKKELLAKFTAGK